MKKGNFTKEDIRKEIEKNIHCHSICYKINKSGNHCNYSKVKKKISWESHNIYT